MSPMELWCNEAQERYVLAFEPGERPRLESSCRRERCPFSVIGVVTETPRIDVRDERRGERAVDVPVDLVLGDAPRLARESRHTPEVTREALALPDGADAMSILGRVLRLPCVADKTFLVTIGDRSVSGLVARDQMVGPWQVPVADCAVTMADHLGFTGGAMAMGEARAPRGSRSRRLGPHGDWRGPHQPRRGGDRDSRSGGAVRELDGRRRAGRHRPARCRPCRRPRSLPAPRDPDPGRKGQPVHAHRMARHGPRAGGERPPVPHRVGVRTGPRRSSNRRSHARDGRRQSPLLRRPRARPKPTGRLRSRPGLRRPRRRPARRGCGGAARVLRRDPIPHRRGRRARLSRPVRRRPRHDPLRDGVRGTGRASRRSRSARPGPAARALHRRARRGHPGSLARRRFGREAAAGGARARVARPRDRRGEHGPADPLRAPGSRRHRRPARRPPPNLVGDESPDAGASRRSGVRA